MSLGGTSCCRSADITRGETIASNGCHNVCSICGGAWCRSSGINCCGGAASNGWVDLSGTERDDREVGTTPPLPSASKRQEGGGEAAGEDSRDIMDCSLTGQRGNGAPALALEGPAASGTKSVASVSCCSGTTVSGPDLSLSRCCCRYCCTAPTVSSMGPAAGRPPEASMSAPCRQWKPP